MPIDPEGKKDIRAEADKKLQVASWWLPGQERSNIVDEGPAWWHGDEEASSEFLTAMGVKLE